ncbi:Fibronectin type III domain [Burkholderia pseudomallei]|nr:Fibronectin type III domain [Burkholderia pseudomallei]
MNHRRLGSSVSLAMSLFMLGGCNGMYITGPAHPYEWATGEIAASFSISGGAAPPESSTLPSRCNWPSRSANSHLEQENLSSMICVDMASLIQLENKYYSDDADAEKRKRYRDRWVQILMRDIDVLWWGYKNGFLTADDSSKIVSETLVTGLAAGSAGITAQTTKTVLAILSATLNGFNTSFDKNVLANQMAPVLFAAIEADRENVDSQIISGLKQDVTHYSLVMASRDVMRYADAGSISNAIASLSGKAGISVSNAKNKRDTISNKKTPGAPTLQTVTQNGNKVTIQFKPPSDIGSGDILGYTVIAQPNDGGVPVTEYQKDGAENQVIISSLNRGVYTITIWAINSVGQGAPSAPFRQVEIK